MSRSRRVRPWSIGPLKLRRAAYLALLAMGVLVCGLALSYNMLLSPALSWIDERATSFFRLFLDEKGAADAKWATAGALLLLGIYLGWLGARNLAREFVRFTNPSFEGKSVGAWVRQRALSAGPNIVAVGGGTGLSTLLRIASPQSSPLRTMAVRAVGLSQTRACFRPGTFETVWLPLQMLKRA